MFFLNILAETQMNFSKYGFLVVPIKNEYSKGDDRVVAVIYMYICVCVCACVRVHVFYLF